MEKEFIYLFGAGASYGSNRKASDGKPIGRKMPLVDEIPKWFTEALHEISTLAELKDPNSDAGRFLKLVKNLENQYSIDTVAKFHYLTSPKPEKSVEYKELKILLCIMFYYIQLRNGYDMRYSLYWASILKKDAMGNLRLPRNLRILSWNYDMQIELSLAKYLRVASLEDLIELAQISIGGSLDMFRKGSADERANIIKLNGSASSSLYKKENIFSYHFPSFANLLSVGPTGINNREYGQQLKNEVNQYMKLLLNPQTDALNIRFSWDDPNLAQNLAKFLENNTPKTIVCIGYSFPTFNRDIDKIILNAGNVEEIYIQDPSTDGSVLQRAEGLLNQGYRNTKDKIKHRPNCNEFFIPYDYYAEVG